jgi:hypothetical protein
MIGALLSAGAGLFSSIMQAKAQQQANNINWQSVLETKRSNRKQEGLQTATRKDAYGNALVYTPGVGWEYDLTGSTRGILDAEQRERTANLTKDAPRNRAAAERMDERSQEANDAWKTAFNKYKYRTEPSEEEAIADTRQTLLNSRRRGLDEAANLLSKQLLRTGSSSNIGRVYKDAANQYADSLQDVDLKAKELGGQKYRQNRDSDMAAIMSELNNLRGVADQTTTSPVNFSSFNQDLTGRADTATQQLASTLASGSSATRQALAQYAQGVRGSAIDISGIFNQLGAALDKPAEPDPRLKLFPPRPGVQTDDHLW